MTYWPTHLECPVPITECSLQSRQYPSLLRLQFLLAYFLSALEQFNKLYILTEICKLGKNIAQLQSPPQFK